MGLIHLSILSLKGRPSDGHRWTFVIERGMIDEKEIKNTALQVLYQTYS